ncbi:ATP-binding protein [Caldalkalibacillus mannanilyticus]|uniref:ATP-binding protein n=1 Tax=Caldalkalibacillus mannanilyticus TaxID=1418 RepID=UPI000684D537|nr:ATP-binding protein [Caldalkalibacillus mannanilyticus]
MNLTSSEIEAIEAYVNMAAVAIRNSNQFNHIQSLLAEKQKLLDVTKKLSLLTSVEEVLQTCFLYVGQVLNNRNIGVHLSDSIDTNFRPVKLCRESEWSEEKWKHILERHRTDYRADPVFQEVVSSKKLLYIPDIELDSRPDKNLCSLFGIKGIITFPLVATGEVLGTISVVTFEKEEYAQQDLHLAQSIIDATATALANVIRMEHLEIIINARTTELYEKNQKLEQALIENQRLSHQKELILNSAGEGIYGLDLEGTITFCNPVAAATLGYTVEELIGQKQERFVSAENEHHYKRKNNTYFPVEYLTTPIFENQKRVGTVVTFKDITERKKTEDLLRKADKLTVLGELAAGVAHEIRNPLTSLKGFLQLLQSTPQQECNEYFQIMLSELDRINAIASEFLFLSKPQVIHYEKKDLFDILHNVLTLLQSQAIVQNVDIMIESQSDSILIYCVENQLKQAFINILKNAIEAMPQGGRVKIKVAQQALHHVSIRFIDQGFGIPEERMAQLGEPFYTTKEKGSGLGLMVSFKIIKDHQGEISFKSRKNRGTKVEVTLPLRQSFTHINEI